MVAVGGTAATLALMDSCTTARDSFKAHHYRLSYARLQHILNELSEKSLEERISIVGLQPQRADVILAGALIFFQLLNFFSCESMLISLRDLMYGVFLDERST